MKIMMMTTMMTMKMKMTITITMSMTMHDNDNDDYNNKNVYGNYHHIMAMLIRKTTMAITLIMTCI